MEPDDDMNRRAQAVRRFNRFYTQRIGVLGRGYAGTKYTLSEARVLFEIGRSPGGTAADLSVELGLDQGYLSRILDRLFRAKLLTRLRSPDDGRKTFITLTSAGSRELARLAARAQRSAVRMLSVRPEVDQRRIVESMQTIERLLGGSEPPGEIVLRQPAPGDLGWIVERHGALYAEHQGWGERFEALVAGVVAEFGRGHDPGRERCWIAELGGERVGSVCVVARSKTVAQLRLLFVEPGLRGGGLGARLVDECVRFAREAGYLTLRLWTDDGLASARRLYARAGFRIVSKERHAEFGLNLVSETWELDLTGSAGGLPKRRRRAGGDAEETTKR